MKRTAIGAIAIVSTFAPAATPQTTVSQTPTIQEWQVPWASSRPRDPYVGPDGRVWFVGQASDYVAVLDPGSGEFRRYDLEAGAGPHNLIVGDDGMVWYAGNRAAHIGRLDPATGEVEKIPMPNPAARDPHTLAFDGRGNIWFTVQGGNFVGRLNIETRAVDLVAVPTARARPYGNVIDPDGRPWIAEFGSYKIATVDPTTMELTEFALPDTGARPRRLALASDRSVWYVDYAGGFIGRLDPASGAVETWPAPRGEASRPYGMAMDANDVAWFAESAQPNHIVGFDTRTHEVVASVEVPSGGITIRHMFYHQPTNTIWFGTDANTVGRLTIDGNADM